MAQDVGYFDFSDWGLVNTDIKDLDGTWEFFPGEFISPGEMNLIPLALEVPGGWKDHQEAWGYGSYRCRFVLPDEFIDISMQLEGIQSCYKIFLNEELIAQVGTLGKSLEDEQPGGRWGYIPLYQLQRENELIIQVSNFQERNGGIFSSILIGPTEKMRTREMKYLFLRSII
ncbi:MAG: hypothetical protein PF447_05725, partial [Spirochaetaceae bacterium]|nr:hypothetical protein [Spirochaetaceae bacterium]